MPSNLSKEVSKTPFFFFLDIRETRTRALCNRDGTDTASRLDAASPLSKSISSAFPDLGHGQVKRLRVKVPPVMTFSNMFLIKSRRMEATSGSPVCMKWMNTQKITMLHIPGLVLTLL